LLGVQFIDAEKAKSAAIVSIDHHGELEIVTGLVRREDREPAKKKKAKGIRTTPRGASPPSSSRI
jgi:hypothetical protein